MAKVPSSTTGTAMAGIRVARQFCRNRNITTTTRAMAISSVLTTSEIESLMKLLLSTGKAIAIPGGNCLASWSMRALTRATVFSALAPEASLTATPAAGRPLSRETWV